VSVEWRLISGYIILTNCRMKHKHTSCTKIAHSAKLLTTDWITGVRFTVRAIDISFSFWELQVFFFTRSYYELYKSTLNPHTLSRRMNSDINLWSKPVSLFQIVSSLHDSQLIDPTMRYINSHCILIP
jgi:hypothetical protein